MRTPVQNNSSLAKHRTSQLPNAILSRVMCSSTPAGRQCLAKRHCSYCVRPKGRSPHLRNGDFVAQSHTPRDSCVRFAAGIADGLAQHSLPGGLLGLTQTGLTPVDRASILAHPLPTLRNLPFRWRQDVPQCYGAIKQLRPTHRQTRPLTPPRGARAISATLQTAAGATCACSRSPSGPRASR